MEARWRAAAPAHLIPRWETRRRRRRRRRAAPRAPPPLPPPTGSLGRELLVPRRSLSPAAPPPTVRNRRTARRGLAVASVAVASPRSRRRRCGDSRAGIAGRRRAVKGPLFDPSRRGDRRVLTESCLGRIRVNGLSRACAASESMVRRRGAGGHGYCGSAVTVIKRPHNASFGGQPDLAGPRTPSPRPPDTEPDPSPCPGRRHSSSAGQAGWSAAAGELECEPAGLSTW